VAGDPERIQGSVVAGGPETIFFKTSLKEFCPTALSSQSGGVLFSALRETNAKVNERPFKRPFPQQINGHLGSWQGWNGFSSASYAAAMSDAHVDLTIVSFQAL